MSESDPVILAKTLWGEARGEGLRGMHAVACVILNRAAKPGWWGRSVTGVCLKAWQFSCWNPGDPNRVQLSELTDADHEYRKALDLARTALAGELEDITNGADHYYAPSVIPMPRWAKGQEPVATIGRHVFFRLGLAGH